MDKFIKILDEKVAKLLEGCGFLYVTERINENQAVYVFENTDELMNTIKDIISSSEYSATYICFGDTLSF